MRELYQDAMNQIYASENLLCKIKTIEPTTKRKSFLFRKMCSIAAIAAVFLISGNIFVQALRGAETVKPEKYEIIINRRLANTGPAGYTIREIADNHTPLLNKEELTRTDYVGYELMDAKVTWENDKIYLKVASQKIDITKDIMDKSCTGTITTNNRTYDYTITGYVYDYSLVFAFE